MNIIIDIPWKRYALIAELTKRLEVVSPKFGKTALQKLVFLLQEVYQVDCGYNFELYTYGPYDSQLLNDLDLVEHWGCVSIVRINDAMGRYQIHPTESVDSIRDKALTFLDDEKTIHAMDDLVSKYGHMTAKQLELLATTVYLAHDFQRKGEIASSKKIYHLVAQIKPKFSKDEILQAITELSERQHIKITAETM